MSFFSQPLPRWLWLSQENYEITQETLCVKDWRKFFRETGLWPDRDFPGENTGKEQDPWVDKNINRRRLFCQWCRFKSGQDYSLDQEGRLIKGRPFTQDLDQIPWDQAALQQLLDNGSWQEVLSSLREELQVQHHRLLPRAFYRLGAQAYSGMGERKRSLRFAILGVFAEDSGEDHVELVGKVEGLF
jgi:hypothetical protein